MFQWVLFSVMIFLLRNWPGLVDMGVWWAPPVIIHHQKTICQMTRGKFAENKKCSSFEKSYLETDREVVWVAGLDFLKLVNLIVSCDLIVKSQIYKWMVNLINRWISGPSMHCLVCILQYYSDINGNIVCKIIICCIE